MRGAGAPRRRIIGTVLVEFPDVCQRLERRELSYHASAMPSAGCSTACSSGCNAHQQQRQRRATACSLPRQLRAVAFRRAHDGRHAARAMGQILKPLRASGTLARLGGVRLLLIRFRAWQANGPAHQADHSVRFPWMEGQLSTWARKHPSTTRHLAPFSELMEPGVKLPRPSMPGATRFRWYRFGRQGSGGASTTTRLLASGRGALG